MTPGSLAIVTATTDPDRSSEIRSKWPVFASEAVHVYTVYNGVRATWEDKWTFYGNVRGVRASYYSPEILGVVPAYAIGVAQALEDGAEIIACLHDDVEIYDYQWDRTVREHFEEHPKCGLLGFGGGVGLGAANIYQVPYEPMQLARHDFISNMRDAEAHGRRVIVPTQVACLDGFSQVGRADFWRGLPFTGEAPPEALLDGNLFDTMTGWGVIHHFYDGMLGCFARRCGWQVWMLPIACHHFGGQTAVGDKRYQDWANRHAITRDRRGHMAGGDQGFWLKAHEIGYDQFKDVLPIRIDTRP